MDSLGWMNSAQDIFYIRSVKLFAEHISSNPEFVYSIRKQEYSQWVDGM
jgi:hypothetical protein